MAASSRQKNRALQAEKAAATRRRIVTAAASQFVHYGYLNTTMADIAREAGVAVRTVYLSFGGKVEVLVAALDIAIVGDDDPIPVLERPWFQRLVDEPDGVAALGVFVAAASEIIDRVYPLYTVTRDGSADAELAEVLKRNKRLRLLTHGQVARVLADKPGFADNLSPRQATEIVYTLMSQETYGLLVVDQGWTVAGWSAWVKRLLRLELFPCESSGGCSAMPLDSNRPTT